MTDANPVGPNSPAALWPLDDMTFAAAQLGQEFPSVEKDRVFAAVNSAAPFVMPAEGRVKLMRRAREFLRAVAT